MDFELVYAADSVVEGIRISDCSDGTPLAGSMRVQQPTGTVESRGAVDVAKNWMHLGEDADETHGDAGDVPFPSDCSLMN